MQPSAFLVAFLMPFALLFVFHVAARVRSGPSYNEARLTRLRIVIFFGAGVILVIWCVVRLPSLMDANAQYFTDSSCTSGTFSAEPRASDACRSETVGIAATRIRRGGRSGTHYYMTLVRANGTRTEIEVRSRESSAVWRAAVANPGLVAQLQLFRGRPVLIASGQGIVRTDAFPTDVMWAYQYWLVFGAGMVAAAFADAIYSWQSMLW